MPATHYKVWGVGGAVGRGVTGARYVGVAGIAKPNTDRHPYVLFNELVCSRLAQALLLPVPPSAIVAHDGASYFVSLDFNIAGERLPPANPEAIVRHQPDLACGILAFDAWVVNPDRHSENLAFDPTTKRVQMFDHSHALLGTAGQQNLDAHRDTIRFLGNHCLARAIRSLAALPRWVEKIQSLPEWYVDEIVSSAAGLGVDPGTAGKCRDFLLDRRERLLQFFENADNLFPIIWLHGDAQELF